MCKTQKKKSIFNNSDIFKTNCTPHLHSVYLDTNGTRGKNNNRAKLKCSLIRGSALSSRSYYLSPLLSSLSVNMQNILISLLPDFIKSASLSVLLIVAKLLESGVGCTAWLIFKDVVFSQLKPSLKSPVWGMYTDRQMEVTMSIHHVQERFHFSRKQSILRRFKCFSHALNLLFPSIPSPFPFRIIQEKFREKNKGFSMHRATWETKGPYDFDSISF